MDGRLAVSEKQSIVTQKEISAHVFHSAAIKMMDFNHDYVNSDE